MNGTYQNARSMIIFGAGRMGLSHAAMAGLLDPNISVLMIEPSRSTRFLLAMASGRKLRTRAQLHVSDVKRATHAVVATPPRIHIKNVRLLKDLGFKGRLLIEKPLAIKRGDLGSVMSIMSGYVLRHSHNWLRLKEELRDQTVESVEVTLETNQDFSMGGSGWRMSSSSAGQVLLEEFGSHCISLVLDLCALGPLQLSGADENRVSCVTAGLPDVRIYLVANSPCVRKSVYNVRVRTQSYEYHTNFYEFKQLGFDGRCITCNTLASEGVHRAAYLRGEDFARQMEVFLSGTYEDNDADNAFETDRLLAELKSQF